MQWQSDSRAIQAAKEWGQEIPDVLPAPWLVRDREMAVLLELVNTEEVSPTNDRDRCMLY